VTFNAEQAVMSVRGEVDIYAAPELGAFFETVIASGCSSVVLDLADLETLYASGMRVIVNASRRLASAGGQLTIRSPSARVNRVLDRSGLADLVRLDHLDSVQSLHLEPSVRAGRDGLTEHLSRVAALPSADDVVDGALRLVVALALATISGADGASVSLNRHGRLATVAASNQTVLDMDASQYATAEGPCVDASIEGNGFHVESLSTETRWPAFIPKAGALGINSILSSPLLAQDRPVGALNIYSRAAAAFAPNDQLAASLLATEASIILTYAGVDVADDQLASRLQRALRTRQIIDQAQGVIMERDGVGENDAYTLLRRVSVGSSRPLLERAEDIVASTLRPNRTVDPESFGTQHE
jgi:anti-anti-sigma factor